MLKVKNRMMRIDCLVKSDRINVLRKQYDTFLEEDKKRKDRNDYILGRLDKMRYNSTAVQLRQMPSTYQGDYFPPSYNRHAYRPEKVERNDMQMVLVNQQMTRPVYHSLQLDVPINLKEETSILKEISKKYILIPKLSTPFRNDGLEVIPPPISAPVASIKPGDIDNNDWKSKYDILEQLKNKEDDKINKYTNEDDHFKNIEQNHNNNLDRANDNHQVIQNYKREDLPKIYQEEIPEKDESHQLLVENELKSLENCTISEKKDRIPSTDAIHFSAFSLKSENTANFYEQTQQNEILDQYAPEANENSEHNSQPEQYIMPAHQNVEAFAHPDYTNSQPEQYVMPADQNVEAFAHPDYTNSQPEQYVMPADQTVEAFAYPGNTKSQPEQYVMPADKNVEGVAYPTGNNVEYQESYPEQEFQPQEEYPIEYEQFMPNTEADTNHTELVINQEENDYSPIEVIHPNELVEEISKEKYSQEGIKTENEYPPEIANTQEFTPNEAVVMQHGQGIDPENYMTDDGTIVQGNPVPQTLNENPLDNSGIEDFDAENREMFYSEQADGNNTYGQQDAGDAYNAEYAQNKNYPLTQEYAYYEGAEQEEGTYPAEINEHEETQQLYDQHYEQQYTTNYEQGYEQQAVYMEQDPNQPQFEQPALYDKAQQEFEQYAFDQQQAETQEQVEQVLDREDGYIEKRVQDPAALEDKQAELNIP